MMIKDNKSTLQNIFNAKYIKEIFQKLFKMYNVTFNFKFLFLFSQYDQLVFEYVHHR